MLPQLQESRCYKDCSELPLYNFIKITETGDLNWLIKSGDFELAELAPIWTSIFNEYCDISNSSSHIYVLQLTREIKHLTLKIAIIQEIVNHLSFNYNQDAVDVLKDWGFMYDYTPVTIGNDLLNVVTEAKMLVIQKGVKEAEYQRYIDGIQKETTNDTSFDEVLMHLSKYQGYHLKSKELTVSEFCAIFNGYKKQAA